MLSQVFYKHGRLCASHPWEIIIPFLTLISWKLSTGTTQVSNSKICDYDGSEENKGVEMVLLSIAKCVAILYCIHQFLKLNKLGSTFLVTIGGLYAFFCLVSCFVFSTKITCLFQGSFLELKKAIPFFFLLMDVTKAGMLAQFALSSSNQEEVLENIAQGMSILGPTITLDTIVETLVIGVGTLSGVKRLDELCRFACISAVINYFVFMLFFPSCLSLILELARDRNDGRPIWQLSTLTRILQEEEEQKINPVLQRVKVLMSVGLVLVHAHNSWYLLVASKVLQHASKDNLSDLMIHYNWDIYVQKWFGSAEQLVMVVFACTFAVMYHYLNARDLSEHLASAAISSHSKCHIDNQSTFSSQIAYEGAVVICAKKTTTTERSTQTDVIKIVEDIPEQDHGKQPCTVEEYKGVLQSEVDASALSDEEVIILVGKKLISFYKLETAVRNPKRGVALRRKLISKLANQGQILQSLPYYHYDYELIMGSCCENVIGYAPVPVGVAGPLVLDGETLYVPMATTQRCLVASINRGCRALALSGGVKSYLCGDGMTRAPVIELPTEAEACEIKMWVEEQKNFETLKASFDATSRFARLQSIKATIVGRFVILRFKALTGDAMGMNMVSKGAEEALNTLLEIFPSMDLVGLSSNYCTDKKSAAINWIEGRGKQVVCAATIPAKVVKQVFNTDVGVLVKLNTSNNYIASAMAGSIGGFNVQAVNIVTAIYVATGQDPAQSGTSANCITQIELAGPEKKDLHINCTMPSMEVGTVGGGTFLPAQASCLEMMGVKGGNKSPGSNASKLARIICATVLAGELSCLSPGSSTANMLTHAI